MPRQKRRELFYNRFRDVSLFYDLLHGDSLSIKMVERCSPVVQAILIKLDRLPLQWRQAAFEDFLSTVPKEDGNQLVSDIGYITPECDADGHLIL